MANTPKYDYSRFTIQKEIEHKNGVYVLTDGEYYYVGKVDDKDYGFRQRFGTYVSNQGRGVSRGSGDRFFQSSDNVKMYWLYWCEPSDVETVKDVENYFMKQYRVIHGEKLVNKNIEGSFGITFRDIEEYFVINHRGNVPLMIEHGIMKRDTLRPLLGNQTFIEIKQAF